MKLEKYGNFGLGTSTLIMPYAAKTPAQKKYLS